jgi:hypothetical protein
MHTLEGKIVHMTINWMQASKFANIVLTGPYNHEINKGIKVYQDCLNWDNCHYQDSYPLWAFVEKLLTM